MRVACNYENVDMAGAAERGSEVGELIRQTDTPRHAYSPSRQFATLKLLARSYRELDHRSKTRVNSNVLH
jgi:hypothetical protein